MTADVTREPTGGQELREAIARAVWERMPDEPYQSDADAAADAVLALREVAALIADGGRVRRVRELLAAADRRAIESSARMFSGDPFPPSIWHDDLRRALNGEDPASRDWLSAPGTRSERPAHLSTPATSERRSAGSTAVARGNHGETRGVQ